MGVCVVISPSETNDQLCGTNQEPHEHSPSGALSHITFSDWISVLRHKVFELRRIYGLRGHGCVHLWNGPWICCPFVCYELSWSPSFSAISCKYWMGKQSQHETLSVLIKDAIYMATHAQTHTHHHAQLEQLQSWSAAIRVQKCVCGCGILRHSSRRKASSSLKDEGGWNLLCTLGTRITQNASVMFRWWLGKQRKTFDLQSIWLRTSLCLFTGKHIFFVLALFWFL